MRIIPSRGCTGAQVRRQGSHVGALLIAGSLLLAGSSSGAVFVVNSIGAASDNDLGDNLCTTGFFVEGGATPECTLRAALEEANTNTLLDEIQFASPFPALGTIRPSTPLPQITAPVFINGYTAPGFSSDSLGLGRPGVVIAGSELSGFSDDGLHLTAGAVGSTILGLNIQDFPEYGIELAIGADGITIQGCWVGLNFTGTAAVGNGTGAVPAAGIKVRSNFNVIGSSFSLIGFSGRRNVVSGNSAHGIDIGGSNNQVYGNYVGVGPAGARAIGNGGFGIFVGGDGNTIGGFFTLLFTQITQRFGNLISANIIGGVSINGDDNVLISNDIGTDASGTSLMSNFGTGVSVDGVRNIIGGDQDAAANVILTDGETGISLRAGASGNEVIGNLVGVDRSGLIAIGESRGGINVQGSLNDVIGNVVGRTINFGIWTSGDDHLVQGNWVGTNEHGDDFGNPSRSNIGISVAGNSNLIGGGAEGAGNVVGFQFEGMGVSGVGNTIQGNWIGTNASGADLGNRRNGLWVTGTARVGADANDPIVASRANEIAFNAAAGVVVAGEITSVSIRGNRIHDNGEIGIDLIAGSGSVRDGETPNDVEDPDEGANRLQNKPELFSYAIADATGNLEISYRVETLAANASYDLVIDFYKADANREEGATWLGSHTVSAPAALLPRLAVLPPPSVPTTGLWLVATATDQDDNTSEFSQPVPEPAGDLAATIAIGTVLALYARTRLLLWRSG